METGKYNEMKKGRAQNMSEECSIIIQDAFLFYWQGLCTKCIFLVPFCI